MSTYWDLYCVSCAKHAGFHINRGDDKLAKLWKHAEHWAGLANKIDVYDIELHLLGDEGGAMRSFPDFAEKHLEHDVRVRDEYGSFMGTCRGHYTCPHCATIRYCNKIHKHEGPCGPEEDKK